MLFRPDDDEDELAGLNLPTEHVMSGTGSVSKEITEQKLEAWADALSRWDAIPRTKIRSLARKGIPDALRHQVWKRLVSTGLADFDLIEAYPHLVHKESPTEQVIMWPVISKL